MFKRWRGLTYGLACLFCGLLVLAIYAPGLPGDFLFDDFTSIVSNGALRLHDLSTSSLLQAMLSGPPGALQRPLSMLSFALTVYFSGLSPFAFKLTNIFIHLGCGVLLGFLAREILRAYAEITQRKLSPPAIAWLSLSIATLWLVHPLNLTTVLYSVQRENALAAACTAAAALAYMTGRRRQRTGGSGGIYIWLYTPVCMFAGILCKENAALTPIYLLVIEFTVLGFGAGDRATRRQLLSFYGVFLLLPALAFCGVVAMKPDYFFSYAGRSFTLYQRLLSESRILLDYLRWAVVPDPRQ
ncbi:MAG TPA: hypothetical protein VGH71_08640, partial [Gammaproteobacteria bacterium]